MEYSYVSIIFRESVISYAIVFLLCSFGIYLDDFKKKYSNSFFIILFCYLLILIGLRFEIGGDWINYLQNFKAINNSIFNYDTKNDFGILFKTEPVLLILNLITPNIYIFNLACALIFLLGLFILISDCDDKYLSLVVAIPFLILLVAFGYQKQSVTLGFIMLSYIFYIRNYYFYFVIFALLACFSHYSASFILIFIFYDLIIVKKLKINFKTLMFIVVVFFIFLIISFDNIYRILINNYIVDEFKNKSQGVLPRLSVQIISIIIFLISYKFWNKRSELKRIIIFNTILTLIVLPFFVLYSNLVDRMLFYFMIIQLMILGNLKNILNKNFYLIFRFTIYTFYLLLTFLWFNFSYFAAYWFPYKNILFPIS